MDNSQEFSEKVDIWSFGLIILETYIGKNPLNYSGSSNFMESDFNLRINNIEKFIEEFNNSPEKFLGQNYNKIFYNFIKKCLCLNPKERSSAKTLLNHKWLESAMNADNKMVIESLTFKYLKDYIMHRKKKMDNPQPNSELNFGEDSENIFA
jgi:serine/threonine protein kinase